MNSCRLGRRSALFLQCTENTARNLLLLCVLGLSVDTGGAQVRATHTEPAMQCADTSKRDAGDVIVTNTCDFRITIQASTPAGTQLIKNLDPGGSGSVAASSRDSWRVFACTWPGIPEDQAAGKEVTYATVKYECDVQTVSAQTQQSASQPNDAIKEDIARLYGDTHPYIDEPLPELRKAVHELGGLKPAAAEEEPSELLAKVGAKADELLKKVPDLISDESVSQTQRPVSQGTIPGCTGGGCLAAGPSSVWDREFNYLIVTHSALDGRLVLQEYRTNRKGKEVQGNEAPNSQGFISAWIVFSSANQLESRFRYLGQQRTDGHSTYVIGFAQIPGLVESPGIILSERQSVPMIFQGIAWIDQSDFRIVRLRTDLLAPQPEISIQRQTANILFGPVPIPTLDFTLWLPQVVHVEMETRGQILQEQHKYSKYRLYKAKSKIVLSPNN
jgi:hypothetical protein